MALQKFSQSQGSVQPMVRSLLVLRLVDRVVGIGPAEEALAALGRHPVAEEEAHVGRGGEEGHGGVEVGDVHVLAPAGALAREQREHDAERAVHAGARVVGHQVERDDRACGPGSPMRLSTPASER